jgi:hypothetical protein
MPTRIPESDLNLSDRRTLRTCDVISVTQQVNLARLIDVGRKHRGVRRIVRQWTQSDLTYAAATFACNGGRRLGGCEKSTFREVGRVCEACRFADDDADARSSVSSRAELFNSALIKHGRGRRAIFDEHLGEFTAARHRLRESVLENFLAHECVRHGDHRTARLILSREKASFSRTFDTKS